MGGYFLYTNQIDILQFTPMCKKLLYSIKSLSNLLNVFQCYKIYLLVVSFIEEKKQVSEFRGEKTMVQIAIHKS